MKLSMKIKPVITLLALSVTMLLKAQPLDLQTCLDSASANMPVLRQRMLVDEALNNKITSYNRNYLPQVSLNGQASYQSDVIEFVNSIPGFPSLNIPKAQYRLYADLYQPIYDAGQSSASKSFETSEAQTKLQSIAVAEYQFKKQVSAIYFQILLLDRQREVIANTLNLLKERDTVIRAAMANGVAQKTDHLRVRTEIINQEQRLDETTLNQSAAREILSLLTGLTIEGRNLLEPEVETTASALDQNPEVLLYQSRKTSLLARGDIISTRRAPQIGAFGQAGLGAPNPYNFFDTELTSYYIIGLRASWVLWDWSKTSLERKNLQLNAMMLEEELEQKEMELRSELIRLNTNGELLTRAVNRDEEILELRNEIRKTAEVQSQEGVITLTDYLDEVLAEQIAAIKLGMDEISLQQNRVLYQLETGAL